MLDATVGGVNANSYVTVLEADDYFKTRLHSEVWGDSLDKEAALITATNVLDWYYNYKGTKATRDQALQWPRQGVYDQGVLVPFDSIPKEVKQATFELVLAMAESDITVDSELAGLRKLQAGPLLIQTADNRYPAQATMIPQRVYMLLRKFIDLQGIRTVRLVRG